MKQVVQLDYDGYYVGMSYAEDSPLEPGVLLLPGGCIDVDPPDVGLDQRAKWVGGQWVFEALSRHPAPQPSLTDEEKLAWCKSHAKVLLAETDFSQYDDVKSCLDNLDDFNEFRKQVRQLMVYPAVDPTWPDMPNPIWSF